MTATSETPSARATPEVEKRPTTLIVNPRAGRGQGALAGALAEAALRSRGVEPKKVTTTRAGEAAQLARAAVTEGAGLVIAVGGDGTLHEVLNGLIDASQVASGKAPVATELPALGVVPVGSGNDYVKMLGVPRTDPRAAAASILDGEARTVDVGLFENACPRGGTPRPELFLNNIGIAFAGYANESIETTRGLPGPMAYYIGSVASMLTYKFMPYELEAAGKKLDGKATIIHVALGKYCGAGVVFTPDADLEDGIFDVFYLAQVSKVRACIVWHNVTHGKGDIVPEVSFLKGKDVLVRGPKDFVLHADGEVRIVPSGEMKMRVVPKAIRVIHARKPAT